MNYCNRCKKDKELSEFDIKSDGKPQKACKVCKSKYGFKKKLKIIIKEGPIIKCRQCLKPKFQSEFIIKNSHLGLYHDLCKECGNKNARDKYNNIDNYSFSYWRYCLNCKKILEIEKFYGDNKLCSICLKNTH